MQCRKLHEQVYTEFPQGLVLALTQAWMTLLADGFYPRTFKERRTFRRVIMPAVYNFVDGCSHDHNFASESVHGWSSSAKFVDDDVVVVVVQYLCNMVYVHSYLIEIVYTPCYVRIDQKGIESAAVKTGQDIK
jgi:hypothetical protein